MTTELKNETVSPSVVRCMQILSKEEVQSLGRSVIGRLFRGHPIKVEMGVFTLPPGAKRTVYDRFCRIEESELACYIDKLTFGPDGGFYGQVYPADTRFKERVSLLLQEEKPRFYFVPRVLKKKYKDKQTQQVKTRSVLIGLDMGLK